MNKKGFIGLGVMGFPMAGHLASNRVLMLVFLIELLKKLQNGTMSLQDQSMRITLRDCISCQMSFCFVWAKMRTLGM